MPIHGSIEEAGLADVLQLIALGRKTGCLSVVDGGNTGEIFLDAGRVTFATVANRRDRLGDLLVKTGRVTREQIKEVVDQQAEGSKRQLGRMLVDAGRISRATLEKAVVQQVEEAVYTLFTWKQGSFSFTTDARPAQQTLLSTLDPERLLLEGARRVDEWSQIEKKIPSFDIVYRQTRGRHERATEKDLTDDQRAVLPLLDGTRDVTGVIETTGLDEFDVGKALYGLIMAGYAQLVERRSKIRHLDYRELLAYVVREAEFADAAKRKEAGRHIADCPTCTERLRQIHVRRTTENTMPLDIVAVGDPTAEFPIEVAPTPVPAAPAVAAVPVAPAVAAVPVAPAAPAVAAVAAVPAEPERRRTERRTGHDRRTQDRRAPIERRHELDPGWTRAHPERRAGPRRAVERRYDPVRREARQTEARQIAAPQPKEGLDWLVTPEESVEMIRASRQDMRVNPADLPPEPRAAAPLPSPAPSSRTPTPPRPRPAEPVRGTVDVRSARSVRPAPRLPAIVSALAADAGSAEVRRSLVIPLPNLDGRTLRRLGVAAGFAGVALFAYAAGQRSGGADTEIASSSRTITASAEAQSPPGGRETETAVRTPPAAPARTDTRASQPPAPAATVPRSPAGPAPRQETRLAAAPQREPVTPPRETARPATPVTQAPPAAAPPTQVAQAPAAAAPPVTQPVAPPPPRTEPVPAAAAPSPAAEPPARTASEPDRELASGAWMRVDRAEAATSLGGSLAAIQGLAIESVSRSTAGSRVRIRITQVAETGERIVLTLTRAGASVSGGGAMRVTALRVIPPSEAYPQTTGTASVGNLLVTARTTLGAEALRELLGRLGEAR